MRRKPRVLVTYTYPDGFSEGDDELGHLFYEDETFLWAEPQPCVRCEYLEKKTFWRDAVVHESYCNRCVELIHDGE